jgi:indolepyruvate ferredoxin oxidoreductase beta subunit
MSRLIGTAAAAKGLDVKGAETIGMAQRGGSVVSHIRIGDGAKSPLVARGTADVLIALEPSEAVRALRYLRDGGMAFVSNRAISPRKENFDVGNASAHNRTDCPRNETFDGDEVFAANREVLSRKENFSAAERKISEETTAVASQTDTAIGYLRRAVKNLRVVDYESVVSRCGAKAFNTALLGIAVSSGAFPFGKDDVRGALIGRISEKFLEINLNALACEN